MRLWQCQELASSGCSASAPELQQAPCLSTKPVAQQSSELAFSGAASAEEAELLPPEPQGPREIEQVGPAKPAPHVHAPVDELQTPPLRQPAPPAEQPDRPHACSDSGACPSAFRHA